MAHDADVRQRWLGVETRHLAALAAVAREGSFSAAADALGYVQSAISQQIAQLERLVGTRVLERDRSSGPVTLTPAGAVLLRHAEELLALYDAAQDDAATGSGPTPAAVRVGVTPAMAARVLPGLLASARAAGLEVAVSPVGAAHGGELADLLATGAVDVAIGDLPLAVPEGVVVEPVLEDRFVALVSVDSPLARRAQPPTPQEVGALRLVGTAPSPAQDAVTAWLRAHGSEPNYVVRCEADTAIQPLVAAGLGLAVCPALAVAPERPGTVVLELAGGPAARWAAVGHRSAAVDREGVAAIVEHARAALAAWRAAMTTR